MTNAVSNLLADARRRQDLPAPALRRLLREQAGLSQAEVAAVIGVGRPSVTRYESGERSPRGPGRLAYIDLLERLAQENGDG